MPDLKLVVPPLGAFTYDPLTECWLASLKLAPRERLEVTLVDRPHAGLVLQIAGVTRALALLKSKRRAILTAVATKIARRHGKEWRIASARALAGELRFRSLSASSGGPATVFCDRVASLGGHSIAFALSAKGALSNVELEG